LRFYQYPTTPSYTSTKRRKQTYLEPNSGSLQKPVEGGYPEKIEDRSAIGAETAQNHVKNYIKGGYSLFQALENRIDDS
jgi:hypothetical protein